DSLLIFARCLVVALAVFPLLLFIFALLSHVRILSDSHHRAFQSALHGQCQSSSDAGIVFAGKGLTEATSMIKPRHYWAPMVYCASLSTASAGALDQGIRAAETETNASPACFSIRAEARWQGAGYDHWVMIPNGCGSPV